MHSETAQQDTHFYPQILALYDRLILLTRGESRVLDKRLRQQLLCLANNAFVLVVGEEGTGHAAYHAQLSATKLVSTVDCFWREKRINDDEHDDLRAALFRLKAALPAVEKKNGRPKSRPDLAPPEPRSKEQDRDEQALDDQPLDGRRESQPLDSSAARPVEANDPHPPEPQREQEEMPAPIVPTPANDVVEMARPETDVSATFAPTPVTLGEKVLPDTPLRAANA